MNEHAPVVGRIIIVTHGEDDGSDGYYFIAENGAEYRLKFVSEDAAYEVPHNTKIALCMSTFEINRYRIVCPHPKNYTEVE